MLVLALLLLALAAVALAVRLRADEDRAPVWAPAGAARGRDGGWVDGLLAPDDCRDLRAAADAVLAEARRVPGSLRRRLAELRFGRHPLRLVTIARSAPDRARLSFDGGRTVELEGFDPRALRWLVFLGNEVPVHVSALRPGAGAGLLVFSSPLGPAEMTVTRIAYVD